jgi:hypothetical protein
VFVIAATEVGIVGNTMFVLTGMDVGSGVSSAEGLKLGASKVGVSSSNVG